jgi:hypothetical protein
MKVDLHLIINAKTVFESAQDCIRYYSYMAYRIEIEDVNEVSLNFNLVI